jgi:hypothetical protein
VGDDVYQAKLAMDAVSSQLSYGGNLEDQTIKAMFTPGGGETVCTGYAKSYRLLCLALGLECYVVSGSPYSEDIRTSHCWNMLRLDGDIYYVDVTWSDYGEKANWSSMTRNGYTFSHGHHVLGLFCSSEIYKQGEIEAEEWKWLWEKRLADTASSQTWLDEIYEESGFLGLRAVSFAIDQKIDLYL